MPYIGNTPADKFLTLAKQSFSTSATTSYTLDSAVSSTQDIALFINSVRQSPVDAYTVSGTALTLTSATASSDEMYCVFLGKTVGTVSPASDSVTTAMIQSNAVTTAKITDGNVTAAKFNADVISGQTELATTPADTDEFLLSDAGVLKRIDYSHIKGGGSTALITSGSWATDSDNIDIASCFSNSDGYDAYKLILNGLSVTSDTQLWLRFKSASGNISDSDYEYAFFQRRSGDVTVTVQSGGDSKILFPPSNLWGGAGDYGYNTEITFYDPTQGGYTNISQQDSYYNSNGDAAMSYGGGLLKQSTDVTGFKIIIAAGSANSSGDVGQYFLYGWKNS